MGAVLLEQDFRRSELAEGSSQYALSYICGINKRKKGVLRFFAAGSE
jgi:hypothetical protein